MLTVTTKLCIKLILTFALSQYWILYNFSIRVGNKLGYMRAFKTLKVNKHEDSVLHYRYICFFIVCSSDIFVLLKLTSQVQYFLYFETRYAWILLNKYDMNCMGVCTEKILSHCPFTSSITALTRERELVAQPQLFFWSCLSLSNSRWLVWPAWKE